MTRGIVETALRLLAWAMLLAGLSTAQAEPRTSASVPVAIRVMPQAWIEFPQGSAFVLTVPEETHGHYPAIILPVLIPFRVRGNAVAAVSAKPDDFIHIRTGPWLGEAVKEGDDTHGDHHGHGHWNKIGNGHYGDGHDNDRDSGHHKDGGHDVHDDGHHDDHRDGRDNNHHSDRDNGHHNGDGHDNDRDSGHHKDGGHDGHDNGHHNDGDSGHHNDGGHDGHDNDHHEGHDNGHPDNNHDGHHQGDGDTIGYNIIVQFPLPSWDGASVGGWDGFGHGRNGFASLPGSDGAGTPPLSANLSQSSNGRLGMIYIVAKDYWTEDGERAAPGRYRGAVQVTVTADQQ
jgi:hypothetical protein